MMGSMSDSQDRADTLTGEQPEVAATPETTAENGGNDWEQKYRELNDQYLRLAADFDNYRKRHRQEQDNNRKYRAESTLEALLPVLDNLERATASLSETSDQKILFQSFRLLHTQLMDALANMGVKKMDAVGQPFDPALHEAISQMENNEQPDQTVLQEAASGYLLHDKVIRPAHVVVSVRNDEGEAKPAGQENPFSKAMES
jgi:molecular chaperone GrpE